MAPTEHLSARELLADKRILRAVDGSIERSLLKLRDDYLKHPHLMPEFATAYVDILFPMYTVGKTTAYLEEMTELRTFWSTIGPRSRITFSELEEVMAYSSRGMPFGFAQDLFNTIESDTRATAPVPQRARINHEIARACILPLVQAGKSGLYDAEAVKLCIEPYL
jgi:hypothetical protein